MTKEQLHKLILTPHEIHHVSVDELRRLVDAYPYSSTIVHLYLMHLGASSDVSFKSELSTHSVLLTSRSALSKSINQTKDNLNDSESSVSKSADKLMLKKDQLRAKETRNEDLEVNYSRVANDYFASLDSSEKNEVELNHTLSAKKVFSVPSSSETLARIYIAQSKYDDAHKILSSLDFDNCKKNRYFAVQMSFLEKLIKNDEYKNE